MKLAPYTLGLVILCWGLFVDMAVYALPLAILLESCHFVERRWVFTKQEFYLLADVTSISLVVLIVYYFSTVQASHFLYALIQILPIVLFPMLLALVFSTTEKLTYDVFFYSLRRDKLSTPGIVEYEHLYVGVCLISMSTFTDARSWFLVVSAAVVGWVLWVNRPGGQKSSPWLLVIITSLSMAYFSQIGLREAHIGIKENFVDWLANLMSKRTDPYKTRTALGKVGELKLSDKILFRVERDGESNRPLLLQEASYDMSSGADWLVLNPRFSRVEHPENNQWRWQDVEDETIGLRIHRDFDDDKGLLPIPQNAVAVYDLETVEVSKSRYGAVRALAMNPEAVYRIGVSNNAEINEAAGTSDLYVDQDQRTLIDSVLKVGALKETGIPGRIKTVENFFSDYKYSLYQPQRDESMEALENFLTNRKAGHCEYFASATVLMLRTLNIPARYVVGFSLQEYSPTAGMYIVRSRHAHAWAIAHDGNTWRVVDTTPSEWMEQEAAQSAAYQPLVDFLSNIMFRARSWWGDQTDEQKRVWLMLLGAVLTVFLIWRMMGSPQVTLGSNKKSEAEADVWEGMDSPLYVLTEYLSSQGRWRLKGETLTDWFERIDRKDFLHLLPAHYQWRFSPGGLDAREKQELQKEVTKIVDALEIETS
jgi:hypothetical protein